jgi:hypothetical protein
MALRLTQPLTVMSIYTFNLQRDTRIIIILNGFKLFGHDVVYLGTREPIGGI